jgi:tRNA(fMet)-specific endonuclease VapC
VKFLLDTNTVSYYLRGVPPVVKQVQGHRPSTIGVSAVTVMELHYGVEKRRSPTLSAAVSGFLAGVQILPFDAPAAEHAGRVRAELERMGVALSLADSQIAGHAIAVGLSLVSSDAAFLRVPHLKVADWSGARK